MVGIRIDEDSGSLEFLLMMDRLQETADWFRRSLKKKLVGTGRRPRPISLPIWQNSIPVCFFSFFSSSSVLFVPRLVRLLASNSNHQRFLHTFIVDHANAYKYLRKSNARFVFLAFLRDEQVIVFAHSQLSWLISIK